MPSWIAGNKLTQAQRVQVLAAFIYRWTTDNPLREQVWKNLGHPRVPLITDEEWLSRYYFNMTKAGVLAKQPQYCEPILPPAPEPVLQGTKAGTYTLRCLAE